MSEVWHRWRRDLSKDRKFCEDCDLDMDAFDIIAYWRSNDWPGSDREMLRLGWPMVGCGVEPRTWRDSRFNTTGDDNAR